MKNKKKFEKELYDLLCAGGILAVDQNDNPVSCYAISCDHCKIHSGLYPCSCTREKWLESEYVEPEVDWSNVPIDTKVLVKNFDNDKWTPRYFAGVNKNGERTAWPSGKTSFTVPNDTRSVWRDMKLYKEDKKDED